MISEDTGNRYVIEDEIEFSNLELLKESIDSGDHVVVQCPFFLPIIHQLDKRIGLDYDETCVVMMHRYRRDIEASEERAKRVNFKRLGWAQKRLYGEQSQRHVSDVKYEGWELQRPLIPNTLDVGYLSLRDHPLWVEDRSAFRFIDQHKVTTPPLPPGFQDGISLLKGIFDGA
jgi:hypothetical protein